ncbi:MAG TPA: TraR/DksA family transcriptional regulator [Burkholderiaceae bacterium]|nr:TraR/DksA family transcriptional regulator [Burkholderiaceae bacterium]
MNTPTPHSTSTPAERLGVLRTSLLNQLRQQRGGDLSRVDAAASALDLTQGDWAQADAERDLTVALQERELQELNEIDAALARLADGSYGSCTDCGADIPEARLQANPLALRCVACQTRAENAHGHMPTPSL